MIIKWYLTSFFGELEVLFFGVSNPAEEVVELVVVVEGWCLFWNFIHLEFGVGSGESGLLFSFAGGSELVGGLKKSSTSKKHPRVPQCRRRK